MKSERKMFMPLNSNPGPGFYTPKKSDNSAICKFSKQKRKIHDIGLGPGLAQKKSFEDKNPIRYSIPRTGIDKSEPEILPGPGQYETSKNILKIPDYMRKRQKSHEFFIKQL